MSGVSGVPVNNALLGANAQARTGFVYGEDWGSPVNLTNAAGATAVVILPDQLRTAITLSGAGAMTVTLPSPALCKGRGIYTITVLAIGGGGNAVCTDPESLIGTRTLVAATAAGVGPDCWCVWSDGTRWYELRAVVNHVAV